MLTFILYTVLALLVFWHGFIHAMGLYRAKLQGRLVGLSLIMAVPVVVVTFVLDVLIQFTIASLVFWQWPKGLGFERREVVIDWAAIPVPWPVGDWFVTHRLRRYITGGDAIGWRYRWAFSICHYLADPFDPTGAHCDSDAPVLKP